jgi:5-methyltetrahydropteroyltriglutamate--homocysteine methyltransferase
MGATPPFRADHVGSFLRPERLQTARERHAADEITDAELRAVEDDCIREVVRKQEEVGLDGITDGEFRRTYFHVDFLERLDGVSVSYGEFKVAFRKDDGTEVGFRPPTMHVDSPVRHAGAIQGADFDFLEGVVDKTAKVCIPAPSMLHFRGGREAISQAVYPDLERFYDDLSAAYRAEIADLAGRGDDPDTLTRLYCRLVNDSIRDRPSDMVVCVHLCRGNFKSAWVARGGYEPVAEILFNDMAIDGFFLEYDDERSGDFAPLRFVPRGKRVILGLMSSKRAEVEPADAVRRRIDEATRFVPLEQCGLSHQCGFSSTAHGNELSEDDQWRKLARCVEVAEQIWG